MNLPLKFLKQNSEPFVPVTSAEAVMVLHATGVKRLDEVLKFKIEEIVTPVGSGLTSYRLDSGGVVVTHSNLIEPSLDGTPRIVLKYDSRGHILEAQETKQLKVTILDVPYKNYNGSEESILKLGDDFMDSNGYIQIRWNTLT